MLQFKSSFNKILATLAVTGCLIASIPVISYAQGGSGLTIFSGVDRENLLDYYLDFEGKRFGRDRYRLRIPGKKLMQGASKFYIFYPDYYDGKFKEDRIEVRIDGEPLALSNVIWDQENYLIEINLEEPLKESKKVEIVFSGVKNPDVGTYYFRCEVLPAVDLPIRQYIGTWIISINP
jgi:Protein of unknown function (DUF2808)